MEFSDGVLMTNPELIDLLNRAINRTGYLVVASRKELRPGHIFQTFAVKGEPRIEQPSVVLSETTYADYQHCCDPDGVVWDWESPRDGYRYYRVSLD